MKDQSKAVPLWILIFDSFGRPTSKLLKHLYNQMKKKFLPNLSIIDLLFHEGENAIKILNDCVNWKK